MTEPEIDTGSYRQRLLSLQAQLREKVSTLAGESLRTDVSPAAQAGGGTEREVALGLLKTEQQVLTEVAAALERIEQGTFGRCEQCQKPIPKPRLEALPYVRHCVKCAQELERDHPEWEETP
jgi:DnaK suppressor protein